MKAYIRNRDLVLKKLYNDEKLYKSVHRYLRSRGGHGSEIEDIWQDSFVLLDKRLRMKKIEDDNPARFIMRTVRYLWNNKERKEHNIILVDHNNLAERTDTEFLENAIFSAEKKKNLHNCMEKISESCKELLRLWKIGYSNSEIAKKLSLTHPDHVSKKRFRCLEKLRDVIKEVRWEKVYGTDYGF